ETKNELGQHFGANLSGVKFFENTSLSQTGETALARGNEIHLSGGSFSPHTEEGKQTLRHELTHVFQQGAGLVPGKTTPALENQATAVAAGAEFQGAAVIPGGGETLAVQGGFGSKFINFFKNLFRKKEKAPVAQQPMVEETPVVEEPFKPFIEEPVIEDLYDDDEAPPVVKEPEIKKPVIEEPVIEDIYDDDEAPPVVKEPVVKGPQLSVKEELSAATNEWLKSPAANVNNRDTNLTDLEAMKNYTASSYDVINKTLRGHSDAAEERARYAGKLSPYESEESIAQVSEQISGVLNKNKTKQDMTVYRGAGSGFLKYLASLASKEKGVNLDYEDIAGNPELLKGLSYKDKGFGSSSITQSVAREFSQTYSDDAQMDVPSISKINVPKGTSGMFVEPFTSSPNEDEFLLDKNMNYRINEVKKIMKKDKDNNDTNQLDYLELIIDLIQATEEGTMKTPYTTPDTTPTTIPDTKPDTTMPINTPVTMPITEPVNKPVNTPINTPTTTPVTEPVNTPVTTDTPAASNKPAKPNKKKKWWWF
ncbi:MAG: DUF4157 domain-containing protein, partial [Oscillospiraceae bacterium]|nr:DUF4157 domain-containing protein [Oscillospiraceae bacterium]